MLQNLQDQDNYVWKIIPTEDGYMVTILLEILYLKVKRCWEKPSNMVLPMKKMHHKVNFLTWYLTWIKIWGMRFRGVNVTAFCVQCITPHCSLWSHYDTENLSKRLVHTCISTSVSQQRRGSNNIPFACAIGICVSLVLSLGTLDVLTPSA